MKYVVYVKNDEKYDTVIKEIKKQMKEFLEVGDKVLYIRSDAETYISALPPAK